MINDEHAQQIREQLLEQLKKFPEEQVGNLRKQIQEMGNDELEQFLKEKTKEAPCLFCNIINGEVSSYKVFENETILAVLDIMPASPGHIILMPKRHVQFLTELSDEETTELFTIAKKIIPFVVNLTKCHGVDIFVAQAFEQKVPHLAINLIPRYEKDNISFEWRRKKVDEKELQEQQEKFSKALKNIESEQGEKKRKHQEKEEQEKKEAEDDEVQKMAKHIHRRMP